MSPLRWRRWIDGAADEEEEDVEDEVDVDVGIEDDGEDEAIETAEEAVEFPEIYDGAIWPLVGVAAIVLALKYLLTASCLLLGSVELFLAWLCRLDLL